MPTDAPPSARAAVLAAWDSLFGDAYSQTSEASAAKAADESADTRPVLSAKAEPSAIARGKGVTGIDSLPGGGSEEPGNSLRASAPVAAHAGQSAPARGGEQRGQADHDEHALPTAGAEPATDEGVRTPEAVGRTGGSIPPGGAGDHESPVGAASGEIHAAVSVERTTASPKDETGREPAGVTAGVLPGKGR